MRLLLWFFAVATAVKLLLAPAYRSTDFEVHRHWLALTHSLPLNQWYTHHSSVWTLDYPPLFALFQLLLSLPIPFLRVAVDPTTLHLTLPGPPSLSTVLYMRSTVAVSDVTLLVAAHLLTRKLGPTKRALILATVIWSPSLLIVDHVHFQYNGFLLGILMVSVGLLVEGRELLGGLAFAVLICSKHLFMVAAPVYFVYLLRGYCFGKGGGVGMGVGRLMAMGGVVGAVFGVAFGPFVYYGQIQQVLRRLFPFGRGLCHAYWAPNFWVFYIILDKILAVLLAKLGFTIQTPEASFTGGLVGNSSQFAVLPQVTPLVTFLLVLFAMSPCIVKAFLKPQPKSIVRWIAYAYTCGFMFGWHVHEKASLHFTIPLGIIATNSLDDARHYFLLSIVSCYSMFPLLFEPQEYPIKVVLLLLHSALLWVGFSSYFNKPPSSSEVAKNSRSEDSNDKNNLIGWIGLCYILGLVGIELWGQVLHPYFLGSKLPFLPLMLVSIYCAIGMMYSWAWQLGKIIQCT